MTLFQHQLDGAAWLAARPKAYLGDAPGTGKTRTILAALNDSFSENWREKRALIVCPAIVRSHWAREADDMGRQQSGFLLDTIKSYDEIVRGGFPLMKQLLDGGIDTLVLDEAHYCKHATSQRAQFLLGPDGYARRLERVWLASGTPMPRNPLELWPQLVNLVPEVLEWFGVRKYEQWKEAFCITRGSLVRGVWREKVVGVKKEETLKEILGHVMLRREPSDDVPKLWWQVVRLDADDAVKEFGTRVISADSIAISTAFATNTLDLIANDPQVSRMRRRLGELKVAPVVEMLREQLENSDEKVVVFAHHRTVLKALSDGLVQNVGRLVVVDGDTPQSRRDEAIEAFRTRPDVRIFLGSLTACQTGMDGLQHAAHRVVIVEPDWAPDVNKQAGHRVARIGQTSAERCTVQMIALAGTLDEAIVAQNARETRMVDAVMNG